MKKKDQHIEALIERYFDGETTAAEECELALYFRQAGDDIPDEWRPCRAMMAYVDEERMAADTEKPVPDKAVVMPMRRRGSVRVAVAALLAAACVVGVVLLTGIPDSRENYAVIDGRVYTSRQVVEREAMEALQMVSADEEDSFSALDMMAD